MHKKILPFLYKYNMLPIAILMFIIVTIINPNFLGAGSIRAVLFDIAIFGFLFIGQALVVITAGIDLSMGSMASTSTVIAVWVMIKLLGHIPDSLNIFLTVLAALIFCGFIGFLAGVSITFLRITPLIATLGSSWVILGIGYILLKGNPTTFPIGAFPTIFTGKIFFLPYAFILLIVLMIVAVFIMNKLRIGRSVYAVGGNQYAALISGIKVNWVIIGVYTLSGVMSSLAGIFLAAYSRVGFPRAATGFELIAITTVVMGGIPFTGGEGNLWNGLFAVFVLRILNKILVFGGLSGYIEGIILGSIIIITLLLNSNERLTRFLSRSGRQV